MPTVVPFHRAIVDDPPSSAPADYPEAFDIFTTWIETEFDNQVVPYGASADPDEPAERQSVVVEVGGKRLEVVLPGGLGSVAAAPVPPRGPAVKKPKRGRQEARRRGQRRRGHQPDAGHGRPRWWSRGQEGCRGDTVVVIEEP